MLKVNSSTYSTIWPEIFFAFWFFLPAALANTAPVFAAKIPFLKKFNYPLDAYKTIGGKRILGDHKTVRGLLSGILFSIFICFLQITIYQSNIDLQNSIKFDYSQINPIVFGLLSAIGSLGGDALKSFFKRRINIEPGKSWIPFDQIDYIIGGILLTSIYIPLSLIDYLVIFIIYALLHPLSTITGYLLKLKDTPI